VDTVSLKGKNFYIERVKDLNLLLDIITAEEFKEDERMPYWAELWPSAVAFAEYILENSGEFRQKKILELGCGLGLVGIVCTYVEGKVLFTDYEPMALKFTKKNFQRNFKRNTLTKLIDWRQANFDNPFEIVVASDVLYEKRLIRPILNVLKNALRNDGRAYISAPDRKISLNFFTLAEEDGWYCRTILKEVRINDKLHTIHIHKLQR
jgi:predicted nicotinamide N-methyase